MLKDGLQQARRIALGRGGCCLSETYVNAVTPLRWECANGHAWRAALGDIKKGTWCPDCSFGVRERLCRRIMEDLLGASFPRARPDWLVNTLGNRMEFDGYNAVLRLAFEHHGEQHYRRLPHFQRRDESLARRRRDDARKVTLAWRQGVTLVVIPFHIEGALLPSWIARELRRRGYRGRMRAPDTLRLEDPVTDTSLERLRQKARSRGGECLSTAWLGTTAKHRFRCSRGHEWEALAANVLARTWCPGCKNELIAARRRNPRGLEQMRELASARGGVFVSERYTSVNDRHRWRCARGHEWEAAPSDVQKGTWCRTCAIASKRDTLARMRDVARERAGECLSEAYVDTYTKLRWRCARKHEWEARPGNVINRGSWCPVCARSAPGRTRPMPRAP
ncbi:zinc-ribbon domain-containing protein [Pyxidicoccus sp. 3LG]